MRALRRIRFSHRKPRSVPYNSATPEGQERFKAETNKLVNKAPSPKMSAPCFG